MSRGAVVIHKIGSKFLIDYYTVSYQDLDRNRNFDLNIFKM